MLLQFNAMQTLALAIVWLVLKWCVGFLVLFVDSASNWPFERVQQVIQNPLFFLQDKVLTIFCSDTQRMWEPLALSTSATEWWKVVLLRFPGSRIQGNKQKPHTLLLLTPKLRVSCFYFSVKKTIVAGVVWELGSKHVFLVGVLYFIKLPLGQPRFGRQIPQKLRVVATLPQPGDSSGIFCVAQSLQPEGCFLKTWLETFL